ncbi:hypothetical protein DESC_500011 [Desulfosarcina cetonica]|nr:hypothetical protein DESC_500011 [Desulfosarcina cetonica]
MLAQDVFLADQEARIAMQSSPSRFGLLVFQTWVIDDQQKGLWHARLEKRRGIRNGFLAGLCHGVGQLAFVAGGQIAGP